MIKITDIRHIHNLYTDEHVIRVTGRVLGEKFVCLDYRPGISESDAAAAARDEFRRIFARDWYRIIWSKIKAAAR